MREGARSTCQFCAADTKRRHTRGYRCTCVSRCWLRSSIAFIFRDEDDEWNQIDFGKETRVKMLEASVASSLAKLTKPPGRPVSEALDIFFLGLRGLYQKTTGEATSAGAHHNGEPHSDFKKLMCFGYVEQLCEG